MTIKYFPFSVGVPWELKNGKYVIPKLPISCLFDILKERNIVVSAFGGLAESFYSLSILEAVNYTIPGRPLYWCGNSIYDYLVKINGLASIYFNNITNDDLERFPTPIFFDKQNNAYFNCLNNYLNVKPYYLTEGYTDNRPIIKQIVEKSTIDWNNKFIPTLRNFTKPDEIEQYLKIHRIHINSPFVLLFPDGDKFTQHDNIDCLGWDLHQIKSFAAVLKQNNISLILMTNNINRYSYSQAKVLPLKLDFAMYLISKAQCVLSKNIDFLLVAGGISNAKLISVSLGREFNLFKNMQVIDASNDIYSKDTLLLSEVLDFIKD